MLKKAKKNTLYNFYLHDARIISALIEKLEKIKKNNTAKSKYKNILY